MKLTTLIGNGGEEAAVVIGGRAVAVRRINEAHGTQWSVDLFDLIGAGQLDGLARHLVETSGSRETRRMAEAGVPVDGAPFGPLYRRPRKIWGIGLNYVEHASELKERPPTEEPASFMKPDTAIIGFGGEVRLPEQSRRVTAEAELGVVIGREVRGISEEDAPSAVAGLTTVVDMTAEDILERNPRFLTRAKSFDTFFSFGPELLTLDEVGDVGALEVSTVVNGSVRRANTVSNMTFSPWFLVSFHSKVMTLLPGDVISTGTPGAAGIEHGDIVSCRIPGFTTLSNPVARP